MDIPLVDVTKIDKSVGEEIINAVEEHGFVYIRQTGNEIPTSDVDRLFELSAKFFDTPEQEKATCAISENNRGWSAFHRELLDHGNQTSGDFKEAFNFGDFIEGKAQQPLTAELAAHEAEYALFASLCRSLCMRILRLFALGVGVDEAAGGEEWFSSRHDLSKGEPSGSILRLLHYPPTEEEVIRAGAHSDYGSMTLLFQRPGQPGLEIQRDGVWSPVPVFPSGNEDEHPPILVNIGDMLRDWTNGLLKSTVHRVVSRPGSGHRYSIAYFCHPRDSTLLSTVPSKRVAEKAASGGESGVNTSTLTAKEHLEHRLAATYGWKTEKE